MDSINHVDHGVDCVFFNLYSEFEFGGTIEVSNPDFSQTCRLRKASISLIEIYLSSSVLT
jgi:hypothetical protein